MGTIAVGSLVFIAVLGAVMIVVGLLGAPMLMIASKIVLRKSVPFGQSFLIVVACSITGGAITWPIHAGVGDVPEGQILAQIMGWLISFGVMTALVDKATAAGLTRSATVAALNFVIYLCVWLVITLALMGTIMAIFSGVMGKAGAPSLALP